MKKRYSSINRKSGRQQNTRESKVSDTDPIDKLAGIEYVGLAGISKESQDGVLRLLQYGDRVTRAQILSNSRDHCLLLTINEGDNVAVKSGFSSGYLGEGPRTFSYVLRVLEAFNTDIEEYEVAPETIERLDRSALTTADLDLIETSRPIRPRRWYDYILDRDRRPEDYEFFREGFPLMVPFAIVDPRIMDLVVSFWEDPDNRLMKGYRRLEDVIRNRTAIDEHGAKLFSQAFSPADGKLTWRGQNEGERAARMNLFINVYTAYRNRRAHREPRSSGEELLSEFLLLNHLFRLECDARKSSKRRKPRAQTP
jgi:hypothetical protein